MRRIAEKIGALVLSLSFAAGSGRCSSPIGEKGAQEDPGQYEMWEATRWGRSCVLFTHKCGSTVRRESSAVTATLNTAFFRARLRKERGGGRDEGRFFFESCTLNGSVRISAGDFMPDLARGLIFSSYSNSYPFTSGYPVRKARTLSAKTSYYGEAIRGGAVSYRYGCYGVMLFGGKGGRWSGDRMIPDRHRTAGFRMEGALRKLKGGITLWRIDAAKKGSVIGIDADYRSRSLVMASEIAVSPLGRTSFCCAVRSGGAEMRSGILIFGSPGGSALRFGEFSSSSPDDPRDRRGFSLFMIRKAGRHLIFRFAYDRSRTCDGLDLETRSVARFESSGRWKGGELKLSLVHRIGTGLDLVPLPPLRSQKSSTSEGIDLRLLARIPYGLRLRIAAGIQQGTGVKGANLSQTLKWIIDGTNLELDLAFSAYRSLRGKASFYFYEPSLEGAYPWKSAWGSGEMWIFSARWNPGGFTAACRGSVCPGIPPEIDFQVIYEF